MKLDIKDTDIKHDKAQGERKSREVDGRLRHLDADDLYLLAYLGDGRRLADAARALRLSQPAITQRIHKIESALGFDVLEPNVRVTRLTEQGVFVCYQASLALKQLEDIFLAMAPKTKVLGATGAWASFIAAETFSRLSQSGDKVSIDKSRLFESIDIETFQRDQLLRQLRAQDPTSTMIGALHLVSDRSDVVGLRAVETVEFATSLWVAKDSEIASQYLDHGTHVDNVASKSVVLVEISKDERLLSPADIQKLSIQNISGQNVRYVGSVAGAIQFAQQGQGILVAPYLPMLSEYGLVCIKKKDVGESCFFDVLVDERAPLLESLRSFITALKNFSET
jgi:DNA-binding transcriptional LysR family regulator